MHDKRLSAANAQILSAFDINVTLWATRKPVQVVWSKPSLGWWKLNVDGSCRGNLGNCGGGGVLQDHRGRIKVGFSAHHSFRTNNEAELRALLQGKRGYNLWYLWDYWDALLLELDGVHFQVVHQFREGNQAVDYLARRGEEGLNWDFVSGDDIPRLLRGIIRLDALGIPSIRK
ncbi:hypothetical protein CIPAW_01G053100 [Carya illinoinensis]|uniref:RNase H type-1 domain-containing protein n=1 Tax=Carya illinoinensis TaxID=32201 RepID=A0A8T1RIJ7_CARIL|nr:hypothetical protein CIPAW_01G053100 [Carya illinoinensis]